ncbi:hypothetical protein PFDSM3638_08360 [Pyrococcus furiosus DSM 3638]|nr:MULTISPECIES: hypothetical protein [Pyrococcus]AFN04988.1 hypothetical protein PFC_10345 [Pyrococcus furiosus COM1]MDK2869470.1 hypothetical protein [Pyrococcus sp.]QEK79273.1 hypothetical protein PFDSM3638_08360 [Pyrococcus furiosus DSM 3638]
MNSRSMNLKAMLIIGITILFLGCLAQKEQEASKEGILRIGVKIEEKEGNKVLTKIFIKNVGNSTVRVAKPIYFVTLKFELYKGNESMKFRGPVPTYLPLTKEETKVLKPRETLEAEYIVDLCWWNVTKGEYTLAVIYDTIETKSQGVDFVRQRLVIKQNVTAKETC